MLAEGVPPQNLDAERQVLGCVLRDPKVILDLADQLTPEDFYAGDHKAIYSVMVALYGVSKPVDVISVGEELARRGELASTGGAAMLLDLYHETLTTANLNYYANIVKDKSRSRECIAIASSILRGSFDGHNSDDIIEEAESKIAKLAIGHVSHEPKHIREVLTTVIDNIAQRKDAKHRGIPTGFISLDRIICGMREGQVFILAGRPSMGKTAFALNICEKVSAFHDVLIVSLEMSEAELTERLLCGRAEVNSSVVRDGSYSNDECGILLRTANSISELNIHIADIPGATVNQIMSVCRHAVVKDGVKFIAIDYLQLIEPEEKKSNMNEQVSVISRRVKRMARELKVPVLLLSQLNREVDKRPDKMPKLSDLRDSGSIEQDADVVLLIHRPEYYDQNDRPGLADIIVAKNRTGPVGSAELKFNRHYTQFENIVPIYDIPDQNYSDF